jgi:hypothetical protein
MSEKLGDYGGGLFLWNGLGGSGVDVKGQFGG